VNGPDPGRLLLDKIDAREQALAREAGQAAPRSTTWPPGSANPARQSITEPAEPPPALPGHPACQQILTVFADAGRPMRARDLCQALDLPIAPKNTENIRSKLKRLASRGILVETEPGLFTQPRP
jgi:hypothetical protein